MTFVWPYALYLQLLLPLLVVLYVWLLRRRKKVALRYASLSIVKAALSPGNRWRRHLPPALFLLAIGFMLLALARPMTELTLPSTEKTVMLVMDVSGSMRAEDVAPSRLVAAQEAARAFVGEQPPRTRIGVVSFAASAALVQRPTINRDDILRAIAGFELQRGTAIGSGLIVAMATLFPEAGIDVSGLLEGALPNKAQAPQSAPAAQPGTYDSAAIILLTDGQRTTGPDPIEAARMAASHGVRVYTVGVGTKQGQDIGFEGWSMRVRLDEETLKTIADVTRGEYFYAGTALDLRNIYESLNSRLVVKTEQTEVSGIFAGIAALLSLLAGALSLIWFGRVV